MYTELSVALVILPDQDDRWDLMNQTPFDGEVLSGNEEGFIIANTDNVELGFDNYHLLPGRFLSMGKVNNQVDFMQKTTSDFNSTNVSNGIGGLAKLKDFSFQLVNKYDLHDDRLYDRRVQVRTYEGSKLSNDADNKYEIHVIGTIFHTKANRLHTLDFKLQGLFASNNPRINGEPFIDKNGKVINTFIVLGDTSKGNVVKLEKKTGPEGVQLHIDSSKYKIKKLFIKESNTDDLFPVTSEWEVIDDKLFFSSNSKLKLQENIDAEQQKIKIIDGTYIRIKTNLSSLNYDYWHFVVPHKGGDAVDYLNPGIITFKQVENDPITEYVCIGNPYGEYEENLSEFYEYLNLSGAVKLYTSNLAVFNIGDAVDRTANIESIDIEQFESIKYPRFLYPESWQTSNSYPYKLRTFDDIEAMLSGDYPPNEWVHYIDKAAVTDYEQNQVVIKIGDEKMLVTDIIDYTVRSVGYKWLSVVRGFDGTEAASHTTSDEVINLSSEESQKPKVKVKLYLRDIIKDTKFNFKSQNYLEFQQGNVPYKWNCSFLNQVQYDYLFPKFRHPDISGELYDLVFFRYNIELNSLVKYNPDSEAFAIGVAVSMRHTNNEGSDERNFFGVNQLYYNTGNITSGRITDQLSGQPVLKEFLDGYDVYKRSSLRIWYTPDGDPANMQDYDYNPVHILKGSMQQSWVQIGSGTFYNYNFNKSRAKITNINDLRGANIVFKAYKLNSQLQCDFNIFIKQMDLTYQLLCPIKDNDWYAEVKYKGTNIDLSIPITTYPLGDNGSIYLIEHNDTYYLFAESDQKPLLVFILSKTGLLFLKDEATLVQYPGLGAGYMGVLEDDSRVAKIAITATGYSYIRTNSESETNYPVIIDELLDVNALKYDKVGDNEAETDDLYIVIDGGVIKVFSKQDTTEANPVVVLKQLLTDFAEHELSDLDSTTFDDVKEICDNRGLKATLILEDEINANIIVDEFCKNFGFILYENNQGKIALAHIYPPSEDDTSISIETFDIESETVLDNNGTPLISIERIDLKYLITDLILRFNQFGDKFKDEILNDDLPDEHKRLLNIAKTYNKNTTEVALSFKCISDKHTALYCAYLKLLFHTKPTRILTITAKPDWLNKDIGTWFEIPSNQFVLDTEDKLYLLLNLDGIEPIGKSDTSKKLMLYEFDTSILQIQEVITNTRSDNYQESITETDQIQEVIDGFV